MKPKIYLIHPDRKSNFPRLNLALLAIASVLDKEYDVKVIDMRYDDYKDFNYSNILFLGISSLTGDQLKYALEVLKYAKDEHPDITTVFGGIHASLLPEQTIKNQFVDFVIFSEAEGTIVELADALKNKKEDFSNIDGLVYKKDGKIIKNKARGFIDMNTLPPSAYHLFDLSKAMTTLGQFPYNGSRGCPHRCAFCYNLAFNKRKWRSKTPENVIRDLKVIKSLVNVKEIDFAEDEFMVNKNRVKEICELMIKENLNLTWSASCRFNYFVNYDHDFIRLLEKSGCTHLNFGAESGSQRILDYISKDININQVLKTAEKLKDSSITPTISFMGGFPNETRKEVLMSLELIDKIKKINPQIEVNGLFLYTSYPGTPLMEESKKYGFKEPSSIEEWTNYNFSEIKNNVWIEKRDRLWLITASEVVRFFYISSLNLKDKIQPRILIGPFYLTKFLFNISAKLRWKLNFFGFGYEWLLWAWAKKKYLGYS